jgi:hypothetical protein
VDDKRLVDVLLGRIGVEVGALDEAEEELVDDLEVGPRQLEHGLVLLRVKGVARRVDLGRYRPEKVARELQEGTRGQPGWGSERARLD